MAKSTFSASVFSATVLPPMFAPVMTAAPRPSAMDTGTKRPPCSATEAQMAGFVICSKTISPSRISGVTAPQRVPIAALRSSRSSRPTASQSLSSAGQYGRSASDSAPQMARSSASSSAHTRSRSKRSSARRASSCVLYNSASTARFCRRMANMDGVAASSMVKLRRFSPLGSKIASAGALFEKSSPASGQWA